MIELMQSERDCLAGKHQANPTIVVQYTRVEQFPPGPRVEHITLTVLSPMIRPERHGYVRVCMNCGALFAEWL